MLWKNKIKEIELKDQKNKIELKIQCYGYVDLKKFILKIRKIN